MATSPSALPPLHARWIDELLGAPLPAETEARCDACVMCPGPDGKRPAAAVAFEPRIKCCTYLPELPSFLVGRILLEPDGPGRASVEKRIDARAGVTPLGLARTPGYDALFQRSGAAMGRSLSLRCPHYLEESGTCGIWHHRNHVCGTFFCKHVRGKTGFDLWGAVKELLRVVEVGLARHCLLRLDVEPAVLARLLPRVPDRRVEVELDAHGADGTVDPAAFAALWGRWAGRERELYVECARIVEPLAWKDVLAITGAEGEAHSRVVRELHARATGPVLIPAALRVGAWRLLGTSAEGVSAITHSPFDPIGLPAALVSVLHYFDGSPTREAFERIAAERGLQLDEALIAQLLDWGVLVPA